MAKAIRGIFFSILEWAFPKNFMHFRFLKRNRHFTICHSSKQKQFGVDIFEIKQSPTPFLSKASLVAILFRPILPILLSGPLVFPFDPTNHPGKTEENKYTIFHNLKAIFHVLPDFQIALTCLFVHPYLQVNKFLFYFDPHAIQAGCYILDGANQSKNSAFPYFIALGLLQFKRIVASPFILGILPQWFDPLDKHIDIHLYIKQSLQLVILLGLFTNWKSCQKSFKLSKVETGFNFYSKD